MEKLTKRRQQAIVSRQHLVDAAVLLFNSQGFQKTTVQDICSAAGMSVGVFYHYFKSKNDILRQVQNQKNVELMELINTKSTARTHMEAVCELLEFLVIQQSSGEFELVCNALNPAFARPAVPDPQLWTLVVDVIRSGQAAGELVEEETPEHIASDLMISARGYVFYWCESGGDFDLLPAFRGYIRRILKGYAGANAVFDTPMNIERNG